MALLFGIIAAVKFHSRKHWHIEVMHSESLIILLGLSMMLRAALTLPGGSRVGLYSASLFFNYYSGMCAYSGLVFGALSITKRRDPLSKRKTPLKYVRQNDNLEELVKATNDANHPADVGKKEPVSGDNNA
ncbi:hypothetical protein GGI26_003858 [Coemansia sp. RSA 1358]|uniref:Uncharacterized protein n=1 Tax=Coemansia umbellata TaxID=1424467 RepID=A0ABQ8PLN0_9FUNG|nr:hypothetical protein EDC05_003229 [Coemansia umbellata]KAJ2621763.1 hypothetical protein GGI26_003858 [Coemansia sp. RSA 1358]